MSIISMQKLTLCILYLRRYKKIYKHNEKVEMVSESADSKTKSLLS